MSQKHTPLPWVASYGGYGDNWGVILNADEMPEGRRARALTEIARVNYTINEGEANAEFIVRACNSHYELVKTIGDALITIGAIRDDADAWGGGIEAAADRNELRLLGERLRAALRKAKGNDEK